MHQKTNEVHIGNHFCLSLTMQDHLLTAGAKHLRSSNVMPLLEELSLIILSMYIMNRREERTHPCCSLTLTLKGFVFIPLTQKQTSDCLYNDLTAVNS